MTAAALIGAGLSGCAQVRHFVPDQVNVPVALTSWPRNMVTVEVQDFRPDQEESARLISAIRAAVEGSLSPPVGGGLPDYRLRVAVTEHRSFFTLGNWHARTRLRATLLDATGKTVKTWVANGAGDRSNMWGYMTAEAVARDAFEQAMAELVAQLEEVSLVDR